MNRAEPLRETVRTFDGTSIAVLRIGEGDGLPLVVCNGLGANLAIWRAALADITSERPVVTWDHRGLFESGLPASDRLDAEAQSRDGLAAARHFGIERFHLVAWSSGGRIALQMAADHPERVAGLTLVCAGYGHSLGALLRLEFAPLLPRIAGITRIAAPVLHGMLRNFVARPEVAGLVRQSGMIGASADTSAFVEYLRGIAGLDARTLFESYHAISGDAAAHLLREIVAPTLVIAGEHDRFTSQHVTTEMVAKIPDARLEVYEDATHYLPIEFPGRLSHDLRRFFKEIENALP
jgi:pimeloyl-ACP methyl ester carboxylesterase